MRTILAGLVGGIVMFVWTSIAHVATPLGAIGVSTLPNETQTISALQNSIGDRAGLYLFPAPPKSPPSAATATGSVGLLVWRPHALMSMSPKNLVAEFATELSEAMIAAILVAWASIAGYVARVGFVTLVGVGAAITTNLSYWNWYGFPTDYSLA